LDSRENVPALQRFPPERSDDRGRFPCIDRGSTSGCGSFDRRPSPCSLPSRSCLSARCFHRVAALNLRALLRVRVRCLPHRFRCRGPILSWAWLDSASSVDRLSPEQSLHHQRLDRINSVPSANAGVDQNRTLSAVGKTFFATTSSVRLGWKTKVCPLASRQ